MHWYKTQLSPRKFKINPAANTDNIGWGILSWILGVAVIKVPVYQLLFVRFLHEKLSNKWLGIFNGLVSSIAELGSAFLFFYFVLPTQINLPQIIGFGLAAGAV